MSLKQERKILCVDMDAFFVSIEQASNPKLKGKPVAVSNAKTRSVIVTSSYEARARGIKTGMNISEALKICPELIVVYGYGRKYTSISTKIAEFLQKITPEIAMFSIDEAFLDITGISLRPDEVSYLIKTFINKNFGITCTVGVGPNRLIAKMATQVNKPDGYYIVNKKDILSFIDSFKLSDIWGIGRHSVAKFAELGIFSPLDMRFFGEKKLEEKLGLNGINIYRLVFGESEESIPKDNKDIKSFGHSMTFKDNLKNRDIVLAYLLQLSEMVSSRARRHFYTGKTVTLTVRLSDMITLSFRHTLSFKTSSSHHIYDCVRSLFDKNFNENYKIRLLGVSLNNLFYKGVDYSNIEDISNKFILNKNKLYSIIDNINHKYGERSISYGSILKCHRKGNTVIPPSWRPNGEKNLNIENII